MIKAKSSFIQVVHSIAKCVGPRIPREVKDTEIGFVGDRKEGRNPQPVKIPIKKAWEWFEDKAVTNKVALKLHYNATRNAREELWTPGIAETKETGDIPMMLLICRPAAEFLLQQPRTGVEFFDWFTAEASKNNPLFTSATIKTSLEWTVVATQAKADGNSVLALDLEGAYAEEDVFHEWVKWRLDGTLGVEATPPPPGGGVCLAHMRHRLGMHPTHSKWRQWQEHQQWPSSNAN